MEQKAGELAEKQKKEVDHLNTRHAAQAHEIKVKKQQEIETSKKDAAEVRSKSTIRHRVANLSLHRSKCK